MYAAFVKLLNMSAAAGILIAAVIVLRFLLRKIPKKYICVLWALVALRLICPFSISSAVSAYNYIGNHAQSSGQVEYIHYNGKSEKPKAEVSFTLPAESEKDDGPTVYFMTAGVYIPTLLGLWAAGVSSLFIYAVISYSRIRIQVRESIRLRGNIFLCDHIPSPFILGIIQPRIYLPSELDRQQQRSVIAHERAHIARLDHLWKPLGYGILCVHWFNPLVWLAYILLSRDIEMACDERVIQNMTPERKQEYAALLLSCSMPKKLISACPVAFGEADVKQRIRGILNYKRPSFWVALVSILLCLAFAVGFLSNPVRTEDYFAFKGAETKFDKPHVYDYKMSMGQMVQGPTVFAELWQNGELKGSQSIPIPETVKEMTLTMTGEKDGYTVSGYRVQIGTKPAAANMDITFPMPEGTYFLEDYSWHGARDIPLVPDQEILLAASIFDCGGDGFILFDFDNADYAEAGGRLRKLECVVLVYAVYPAKQVPVGSEPVTLSTIAGPAIIDYGALHFNLPEGYFYGRQESSQENGLDKSHGILSADDQVIGGVQAFPMEESKVYAGLDWIKELNLWEWNDASLGYYADGVIGIHCSIEFFSDVPPGVERTVLNRHNFYYSDGYVYDLWFDGLHLENDIQQRILDTVYLEVEAVKMDLENQNALSDFEEKRLEAVVSAIQNQQSSNLLEFVNPVRVDWSDYTIIEKVSAGKQMTLEELLSTDHWKEQPIPEGVTGSGFIYRGYLIEAENGNTLVIRYDSDNLCIFNRNGNCLGCYQGSYTGAQMVNMLWDWARSQLGNGAGVVSDLTLTQTSPQGMLSVLMRPTTALSIDGMGAVTPENQEEWIAAWNAVMNSDKTVSDDAEANSYYGVMLHYGDTYLNVHKDGEGFFLREMGGQWYCYSVKDSKPLIDLLKPILQEFNYSPVKPSELKGIQYANLVLDGMQYAIFKGDPKLSQLESILTSGTPIGYMPACWFTSLLTVALPSGETKTISVATDSCGCYLSDGVCYEYPGDNARLYQLFGVSLSEQ